MSYTRYDVPNESESVLSGLSLYYDSMYIGSGGTAEDTTMDYSYMYVSDGGRAEKTTVKNAGVLSVFDGGTAKTVVLDNYASAYVASGGLISDLEMSLYASATCYGEISGLVMSGGSMDVVSSGGKLTDALVNGGELRVTSSASAIGVTVNAGFLGVTYDANLNSATIHSGASMNVGGGLNATASNVVVSGGQLNLYSGGAIDKLEVMDNFDLETWSGTFGEVTAYGGTLDHTSVTGYGSVTLSSGAVANNTVLSRTDELRSIYGGEFYVYNGAVANNTVIGENYNMRIWGGGSASGVTVLSGGNLNVSHGGTAADVDITSSGIMCLYSGTAIRTTVGNGTLNAYGIDYDGGSGVLESTTVNKGGYVYLEGEISATSMTVNSGGRMTYQRYEYGSFTADHLMFTSASAYINGGGSVTHIVQIGGETTVGGGKYDDITLSGGYFSVNYATIDGVAISDYGYMHLASATATNVTILNPSKERYAEMRLSAGAAASNVSVDYDCFLELNPGASADSATVASGGWIRVYNNASATNVTLAKGGEATLYLSPDTYVQGTSDGKTFELKDGVLSDFTVLDGGITPIVCSGGTLMNVTTIKDGGGFAVSSGGSVLGKITVEKGGGMYCYGGYVEEVVENGGYVDAHPYYGTDITFGSNTFTGVHLTSGQSATVHSGTTANSTLIEGIYSSGAGASLRIYDGGIASNTEAIHCGYLEVSSGGTAVNTLIHSSASIRLEHGASAVSTTIKDGARLFTSVYSSGAAYLSDTVISSAGTLYLAPYSGCVSACNTVVESGGTLYLAPAGSSYPHVLLSGTTIKSGAVIERISSSYYPVGPVSAYDTVLESGASLTLFRSDYYSRTTLKENAALEIGSGVYVDTVYATGSGATVRVLSDAILASITVGSGASVTVLPYGEADYAVVDGGTMRVIGSGDNQTAEVYSSYVTNGTITLESGALIYGGSAGAGGRIELGSGCWAGGDFRFVDGGEMHVEAGGRIFFDLNIYQPPSPHIIVNDMSKITGAPDYRILVKSNPQLGTYMLAAGAEDFNSTITIVDYELQELGTLKPDETVRIGSSYYTLRLANGTLGVTISELADVRASKGDIDNSGISDVLFQWTGGGYQLGYWMNGRSEYNGESFWRCVGATHSKDWEVLGNYVMDFDGNADTVLVGNVQPEGGFKGAYIGYYKDGVDADENWVTIGYLTNEDNIVWQNKVCNLTGNEGANSIVWYAPELHALGVWKDGREDWQHISDQFGGTEWTLAGCGDFDGDGKDSIVMSLYNGVGFYSVGLDGIMKSMGSGNWVDWEIRAIGDFSGDRKDDIVAFHKETGSMVLFEDGVIEGYTSLGQLDPNDWFVVGAGDYNGDQKDDLLVRQYSTGTLGYYVCAHQDQWVELGNGVDMQWTVIA